jgi:hypothetical protein
MLSGNSIDHSHVLRFQEQECKYHVKSGAEKRVLSGCHALSYHQVLRHAIIDGKEGLEEICLQDDPSECGLVLFFYHELSF